jgi:hypothetical protein
MLRLRVVFESARRAAMLSCITPFQFPATMKAEPCPFRISLLVRTTRVLLAMNLLMLSFGEQQRRYCVEEKKEEEEGRGGLYTPLTPQRVRP